MYSLGCYIYSVSLLQKQHLTFLEFTVFYCHSSTVFHRKIYGHLSEVCDFRCFQQHLKAAEQTP